MATSTRYVAEIKFAVSDGQITGVPNLIPVDMNKGSKGKYIYPMIEYSNVKSNGISGLAFIQNNQVTPTGYTKMNQDLNEGAGGTYNYLCISKRGKNTITEITFVALDEKCSVATRDGYYVFKQDLNTGADKTGAYVYLLYKTDTGNPL